MQWLNCILEKSVVCRMILAVLWRVNLPPVPGMYKVMFRFQYFNAIMSSYMYIELNFNAKLSILVHGPENYLLPLTGTKSNSFYESDIFR